MTVTRDAQTQDQDIDIEPDLFSNGVQQSQKVSHNRLSDLMKFILIHTCDNDIDRADIVARYYNLSRRYRKHYTDPCFSRREQREFDGRFGRAQAAVTKSLRRMEERGLVELLRCRQYVKRVRLTSNGELVAHTLKHAKQVVMDQRDS